MLESVTSTALASALNGLSLRQRTIANNIANVNTPNYNVNLDTETLSNIDTVLRFQFASRAIGYEFSAVRSAMRTS